MSIMGGFTYRVYYDIIFPMNTKQKRVKDLVDSYFTKEEFDSTLFNDIKTLCGIPLDIRIPNNVVIDTAMRFIYAPEIEEIPDRLEKTDIEDFKDILGIDVEDLFKI